MISEFPNLKPALSSIIDIDNSQIIINMDSDSRVPTLVITHEIPEVQASLMLSDSELNELTQWFRSEYDTTGLANPTAVFNNAWGDYRNDALLWWFNGQLWKPYTRWDDYGSILPEFHAITQFPLRYFTDAVSHNSIVSVKLEPYAEQIRANARCFVYNGSQHLAIQYTWFVHADERYWIWNDVTNQARYEDIDGEINGFVPTWPASVDEFTEHLISHTVFMTVVRIDDTLIWCLPKSEHAEFKELAFKHGLDTGALNSLTF